MRGRKDARIFSYKNVGRHLPATVSNETPRRKDIEMKLLCIFAAFLAISLAEESKQDGVINDSEAVATVELLKTSPEVEKKSSDVLETAASNYNYPQNQNVQSRWASAKTSVPYYPPQNYYPQNNFNPPQNNYVPPQNNYVPPQNNYVPPQNNYVPPNDIYKPQNDYVPPQNNYVPPQNNYVPPNNNYVPPNNNYVPPNNNWKPPHQYPSTPSTTTPSSIIKNEMIFGDNGSYKYEYEVADGTHASEEGYLLNPNTDNEILVKKGWYSYTGPDGKVYTVTYWADHTGFHATGDHLPTPPPIPPAIQASIEQNAKEEAAKAEAEKNKPQQPVYTEKPQTGYYPQPTYAPPTYPPQQTYYPPQQTYYPPQQTYYPQNNPSYGK